jgi:23S rRNA pseudouridine1911/1915/1917 synthase
MLHELEVDETAVGDRLDVFLEARLPGCSRSLVARCIKQDLCTVTPGKAKPGYRLRGGEAVAIEVPDIEPLEAVPEDIPLAVLHEDDELLVVNKAPGMVVHPAIGHHKGTLLNAVLGRYDGSSSTVRPGLIHRLDADTSGVIAIARTPEALTWFQDAFRERRVVKRYLALAHGRPREDVFEHKGWIGRHYKDFRKRGVQPDNTPGAKDAHTGFVRRATFDGFSALECRLHTGRTHQIRVHLADLGHAILADGVYGRSVRWPLQGPIHLRRQGLHAWRLELPRRDGSTLQVTAPIPDDLQIVLGDTQLEPLTD